MNFWKKTKRGVLLICLISVTITYLYIYDYPGVEIKTVKSPKIAKAEHNYRRSKVLVDFRSKHLETHYQPLRPHISRRSKDVTGSHSQTSHSRRGGSNYVIESNTQPSRVNRGGPNDVIDTLTQLSRSYRSRRSKYVTDIYSHGSRSHRRGFKYVTNPHFQSSRSQRSQRSKYVIKVIHQSWKSKDLPPRFQVWSQSWRTCYPGWEYRLWTDDDNRRLIEEHYPWFLKRYNSLPQEIYRADAARYFYMYHYGGIYADLDAECLRPFEHLLANSSVVFGAMTGQFHSNIPEGYTQNSFMYSRRKHAFWREVMDEILDRVNNTPERTTGPIMLGNVIQRYRKRHPAKDFIIYPPVFFNPFSWLRNDVQVCKDLNKMSNRELMLCRETHRERGAYVVQYHVNTWGRGQIL